MNDQSNDDTWITIELTMLLQSAVHKYAVSPKNDSDVAHYNSNAH